ncbi:MAG: phage portal protein [Clostridiales bacterium]|nr:phage portal protein [Clostridiales bacterium]
MSRKKGRVRAEIIKARDQTIEKAETTTQVSREEAFNGSDWVEPPVRLEGLKRLVTESSILPQCIRAYKNNICGFGIGARYSVDEEETPEMAAEYDRATEIIELLNVEQDTKEVFEDIIEARETYGIAYIEVLRNLEGEVTQIDFIRETPSVRKTMQLEPYIEIPYYHHGMVTMQKKKFRKYRQQVREKTEYIKDVSAPLIKDKRDMLDVPDGQGLELQYQANEILEFAIGTEPYGEIRWMGQILGVDGSRAAESLNNNYFKNGRHTPLLIMVKGGTLTDESFRKLQMYMDGVRGEAGQHKFLILEAESMEGRADFDEAKQPEIEVHDLANVLQKDELFQEYLDNNRKRVQSAFQLPDLYVGYTTDFNRATSQTAQEVTEEQAFQPERKSMAWAINNKLLNCYQFKYVEAYFIEPDISNPDDLYKIFSVANNAGGVTPQMAKEVFCESTGRKCEPYEEEWAEEPIAVSKNKTGNDVGMFGQLAGQIAKAEKNQEPDEVVAVMKEVRKVLLKMQEGEHED